MTVYGVHLIRTDTTKMGDGKASRLYESESEARKFCTKKNTPELKDQSYLWVVRPAKVILRGEEHMVAD